MLNKLHIFLTYTHLQKTEYEYEQVTNQPTKQLKKHPEQTQKLRIFWASQETSSNVRSPKVYYSILKDQNLFLLWAKIFRPTPTLVVYLRCRSKFNSPLIWDFFLPVSPAQWAYCQLRIHSLPRAFCWGLNGSRLKTTSF